MDTKIKKKVQYSHISEKLQFLDIVFVSSNFYKHALGKKTSPCASWDKTKALRCFKINQCKFLSVETTQIYILVWD